MHYKIACPLCQHGLSIKEPKIGKYKPKCSGCGEQFAIVVEAGEPPKIKVGRIAKPKELIAPVSKLPEPVVLHETIGPESTTPSMASVVERARTSDHFDETIEQPNLTSASVGSQLGPNLNSVENKNVTVLQAGIDINPGLSANRDRDFSVNAVTMEQPLSSSASNAPSPMASSPSTPSAKKVVEIPNRLGGYRIVKEIGAGGMGSVYLARQLSLDRPCALKTIQAHWAKNPRVIARFIREAYAAAQLTHHNVVQIYDLGQEDGTNFFSMELVSGGSLDDQLKAKGKFPPKLASTLILQAARGLKFAHDHGMVHRDIKPANLMMTSDGLLKVADMGLVKTPTSEDSLSDADTDVQNLMLASARTQVTAVGSSLGTPAYMSPEQSTDAGRVDKRADIYSLGCTFYALLTGKPPFDGNTMLEVITKHRTEKIVRPELIVSGLPNALGDVIEKMTEKNPADRYQDLEDVICDLEVYLELREVTPTSTESNGQSGTMMPDSSSNSEDGPQKVSVEQSNQIQAAAKQFNGNALLVARRFSPLAWFGLCGLLAIWALLSVAIASFSMFSEGAKALTATATNVVQSATDASEVTTSSPSLLATTSPHFTRAVNSLKSCVGYLLAILIAPLAAIGFAGYEGKSPLALRWRESLIENGVFGWAYWLMVISISVLAVFFMGLIFPVLIAVIGGVLAGGAYYFGIEKTLANARKSAVTQSQSALRQLRLKGTDERSIRHAVMENSGNHWEEFFEANFGYNALRSMRSQLKQSNRQQGKPFRPWRDRLIDQWDERLADTRRQREEKLLGRAEKAELVAAGVTEAEAQKRAEAMALALVDAAKETRISMIELDSGKLTKQAAEAKRQRIKQMMTDARSGKLSDRDFKDRNLDRTLGKWLGSKFRFACAAVLILGTGMWIQSNKTAVENYWQTAKTTAQSTVNSLKNTTLDAKGLENATSALSTATQQTTLAIQQSPQQKWNGVWLNLIREKNVVFVGIAGLLMLIGAVKSGWKWSLILVPIAFALCVLPNWIW